MPRKHKKPTRAELATKLEAARLPTTGTKVQFICVVETLETAMHMCPVCPHNIVTHTHLHWGMLNLALDPTRLSLPHGTRHTWP